MRSTVRIPLTQGKFAVIDEQDLASVSQYKWRWTKSRMDTGYAEANVPYGRKGHVKGVRRPPVKITMHQLILGTRDADHKNGDGLDNRRSNLRKSSRSQQCQNRQALKGKLFKGVDLWYGKWRSRIKLNGVSKHLGYFSNPFDAARSYNNAALELFGEFARLNEIPTEEQ